MKSAGYMASDVDVLDCFDHLTVTVGVRNVWRARLGLWLLALAARVLRCGVEVTQGEPEAT